MPVKGRATDSASDTPQPADALEGNSTPAFKTPRPQFLGSVTTGKIEAEVGLFVNVNVWETLRRWFNESERGYWGWDKTKIPILPLDPDQLWEYDPATPRYYRDRHRDLPPEVAAVVQQAAAATAAKGSSSSLSR